MPPADDRRRTNKDTCIALHSRTSLNRNAADPVCCMSRLYPEHLHAAPAQQQPGRGLRARQEAAKLAARSAAEQDALPGDEWPLLSQPLGDEAKASARHIPSVQQLHRLLLLEESAMEADICRC